MDDGSVFQWPILLVFLAALLYFEVMRRLDRYWANRTPLSDEERLWNHARNQGISEHEVFRRAAATWTLESGNRRMRISMTISNRIRCPTMSATICAS
jgi:hypothetical protein